MDTKFYDRLRKFGRVILAFLFPVRVRGVENLPADGAAVLCANHTSLLDPVMLALQTGRYISFMAKEELFRRRGFAGFLRKLGAFPVNRGGNDMRAIRESMRILKDGGVLGIFPQGTRAKHGVQPPMLPGTALIALRAGAPVYPVYISRPFRPFRRTLIAFGQPVDLAGAGRKFDNESLAAATKSIETAVFSLAEEKA